MSDRNCASCRYWSGPNQDGDGYCHRHPPVQPPERESQFTVYAVFPCTEADLWCGEWSAKRAPALDAPTAAAPSDGGFLISGVIDVDVSGPVRRFFARLGLAKRKYERREFAKDFMRAMREMSAAPPLHPQSENK